MPDEDPPGMPDERLLLVVGELLRLKAHDPRRYLVADVWAEVGSDVDSRLGDLCRLVDAAIAVAAELLSKTGTDVDDYLDKWATNVRFTAITRPLDGTEPPAA